MNHYIQPHHDDRKQHSDPTRPLKVQLTAYEKASLVKLAKAMGMTPPEYIQGLIQDHLE